MLVLHRREERRRRASLVDCGGGVALLVNAEALHRRRHVVLVHVEAVRPPVAHPGGHLHGVGVLAAREEPQGLAVGAADVGGVVLLVGGGSRGLEAQYPVVACTAQPW